MNKNKEIVKNKFRTDLESELNEIKASLSTADGGWIVKGLIDVNRKIYALSVDTKVLSKIMEVLILPTLTKFAKKHGYNIKLPSEQNFYPDVTFTKDGKKFALDIKSSYRKNASTINGLTLGAFTGYFRNRKSTKNTTYPYNEYSAHFILGIVYSRTESLINEKNIYKLSDLEKMKSVVKSFDIFLQEKYKIAIDRPGSGNTKNIGGLTDISKLKNGTGSFVKFGTRAEEIFDDYWKYYYTKDMAIVAELSEPPYRNLKEYKIYKDIR